MTGQGKKGWLFLAALVSITVLGPLSIHMYLPIMPYIQRAFGASTDLVQFSFSLVLFVMAAGTLAYGTLSDRFGRRPVLLAGLMIFAVGSAVCAVAGNMPMLLVGRLLQAVGAGCGIVLARAIARDVYGPDRLAKVIAYITAAYVLGPMFAPPIGGAIADLWGWNSVFVFAVAVCIAVSLFALRILHETHVPLAGSPSPAVGAGYRRLLSSPAFVGYALNPGFTSGAFFALSSSSSFLMVEMYGGSALEFGIYFMLLPGGYLAGNLVSGRLSGRVSTERMVVAGGVTALASTGLLAAALILGGSNPVWMFAAGGVLAAGQGLSMPFAQAAAINVDPALTGTASGIVVFLHFFGAASMSQIVGILHDGTFYPMLGVVFASSLMALLSGLWANTHARPTASPSPS